MRRKKQTAKRYYDRQIDRNVYRVALKKAGVPKPNKKVSSGWRSLREGVQHG